MKCKGFTIAEILVTLVILGFIGALGVPMIGPKKAKNPVETLTNHGAIECYYDEEGNLHRYMINNTDNKDGSDEVVSGNYCEFTAPAANMFVVHAVGAGGNGAVGVGDLGYSISTTPKRGYIRTDENFQYDLNKESTPDWVREEWDRQWSVEDPPNPVEYIIQSPLGRSGGGYCDPKFYNNTEVDYCYRVCSPDNASACPDECRDDKGANGGNSGVGANAVVKVKLLRNDEVEYAGYQEGGGYWETLFYKLRVGSKSIVLKASGDGTYARSGTGQGKDEPIPGTNGANFDITDKGKNNFYFITGSDVDVKLESSNLYQTGGIGCSADLDDRLGKGALAGKLVSIKPQDIRYSTQVNAVQARFGLAGGVGEYQMKVLEKIPASTKILLKPAKNNDYGNKTEVIIKSGDEQRVFMHANSGYSEAIQNIKLGIYDINDLPFPRKYYPESFKPRKPDFRIPSGYKSKVSTLGYLPGTSAAGAFPIVDKVPGVGTHWINGAITNENADLGELKVDIDEKFCEDSQTSNFMQNDDRAQCGLTNTKGKPGVVIISW